MLETFVVNELVRQTTWSDLPVRLYHYRDEPKREVDVIVELPDGRVACVEVKSARDVDEADFRHLQYMRDKLGARFVNGVVIHLGNKPQPFGDRLTSMPISALWSA